MDEHSVKRGIDGMAVPRKRMGLVLRDTANTRDRNGQICSRSGCSSTANPPKVVQVRSSEKGKSLRPSMQSFSSGKEVIGSSRRTTTNPAKPLIEPRKTLTSQFETGSSVTSSGQDEPEISQLNPLPVKLSTGLQAEEKGTKSINVIRTKVGKSNAVSNLRSQRNLNQRPGLRQREIESIGPVTQTVSSKYRLRNLRCNTISDDIPSSCSTSDSTLNRKKDVIKKRNSGEDSSSTVKGKKTTGPSPEGLNSGSRNGISISDARRSRNIPSHRDNSRASVRTKKSVSSYARGRFSSQGNENPSETNESPVESPGILCHASEETPVSRPNSYSRPDTGNEELCGIMCTSLEEYDTPHSLINQDGYNMDGYSEVLLALERLEQDEELTDEQIHLLETNLFLDRVNFFDHHRDMRLDIDNMSYEELLALEERIGTVSTALTEEALSDCLRRSTYQSAPSNDPSDYFNEDNDIKCCICQEEYVVGDEVGTLHCTHKFHVVCIQDWLKQKNWCPICKGSAAQSNSSSSH